MNPTVQLAIATFVFLAAHFVPSMPLRAVLAGRMGERGYLALYSLASFATLGWMIWAFVQAPPVPLWPGLRHLPSVLMPLAFILLAGGLLGPNPTAVMQERTLKSAQSARGMIRVTRHPFMWAVMLWSAAHVLARGELNATVFFGGFFVLAALGTVAIDRRKAKSLGEDWKRFAAATSNPPFLAIVQGRNRLAWSEVGWLRPSIGLAAFALVFWLHPWLFGARPY